MICSDDLLAECKFYVDKDKLDCLKQLLNELLNEQDQLEYRVNYEWLWQKIYLHACSKKKVEICTWLETVYSEYFDEVTKIALRPTMVYAKYMKNR